LFLRFYLVHCCCLLLLQEIQQLFKKHVLYIVVEDISQDMALTLGVTCNTSPETVLQVLSAWSAASSAAAPTQQWSAATTIGATDSAPASAAAAAAATDGADGGGFTSTLHDMSQLYHHLSRFLVQSELPSQGFSILQDQDRLAALPKNAAVRVQASKAFIETPLIWLPDTDEFLKAAAAYRAAESQRGYMDEDSYSMGGSSFGQPGRLSTNSNKGGRGPVKQAGRVVGAAQKRVGAQQGAAAASDAAAHDVMYDGTLMGALSRTPMRGRFYSPDQLRFTDEAKTFEITFPVLHQHYGGSSNSAAGVRPPPMLRVLGAYYGAQRALFVDLLQRFKYDKWIPLVGECVVTNL
jgi:hypothetical protein